MMKLFLSLLPYSLGNCPSSHPWVYNNGDHCCETNLENVYAPQGELCDGGELALTSTCCFNNDAVACSDPPCPNYEGKHFQ